jgi:hypothetical protein
VWKEIQSVEPLALIGGLYCVGFINPDGVVAAVWRERLLFILDLTDFSSI